MSGIVSTTQILEAYRLGYYPMASGRNGEIGFFYYEPRGIIPLDERFTIRKSLRKILTEARFNVTFDTAFEQVIRACARYETNTDDEIWLSEEMIELYRQLHCDSIAHSVEVWEKDTLVGGLYGLAFGSTFCGESMFSVVPFASQVALVALVHHLREKQFTLLDAQMESEHLKQFGLYTISQQEYLRLFHKAMSDPVQF